MIPWKKNSEIPCPVMKLILVRFYLENLGLQYMLLQYRRPYDLFPKKYQKNFIQWCRCHCDDAEEQDWVDEYKDFEWYELE